MPIVDDVGYGQFTGSKMETMTSIFEMHLAITQEVLKYHKNWKQVYKYIDATAGKGYVPESTIPGSPLVFLKCVNTSKIYMPYFAHFVEQSETNINELRKIVFDQSKMFSWQVKNYVEFHQGDYSKILPLLLGSNDDRELGLIFIDHSGELPNFDTISEISQMRPKMEILLYLSARNIKRLHHIKHKSLLDYMQQISKKNWLIRKPAKWDNLEWTFLLGSNTNIFGNYKKIDFFRLDSEEAQNFFPKLNLTSKERMEKIQPKLPNFP
jgi:three-Cys-motif partner protein